MPTTAPSSRRSRYPAKITARCVRLYYRFPRSHRGVEELMLERGLAVSYESIRRNRRGPQPRDRWHLDGVFIKTGGRTYYLRRAVDADGMVLDIMVLERRNQEAAKAFLRRVVEGYPAEPRVIVTGPLAGYGPVVTAALPRTEYRKHKGLNNRAENPHQPPRQRERAMRRFRSPAQAQRFLERFGSIREHFCPGRHRLGAAAHRAVLADWFASRQEVTSLAG